MWRKIHSNRNPRDTVYAEIKKEFETYFNSLNNWFRRILICYPRLFFLLMIILMLVSAVLSFTVFRTPESQEAIKVRPDNTIRTGFDQITHAADRIKLSIRIKDRIDSLTALKQLSSADSLTLDRALDSLQQLQH